MNDAWVLVADSARARLFRLNARNHLHEIETMQNPRARLHEGDLVTDGAGHISEARQPQHSMHSEQTAKERVIEDFARDVVARLEAARAENAFDRLCIVASPEFLGLLRRQLSEPTKRLIVAEVARDLSRAAPEMIRDHLPLRV